MNKVKIVGATASAAGVTFYLDNGEELNLKKDTARTKAILDQTVDALARHETVTIDLDDYSVEKQIEKKTNGLIRFIREKVFGKTQKTTSEVLGRFELDALTLAPDENLVAVVGHGRAAKKVPGMQHLEAQMHRAVAEDNVEGLKRFIERIASVIDTRGHSMDELLNFMKRGDLPIADDGTIVAYKVLATRSSSEPGVFVDCHSRNVIQRLGSRVSMPESLVDSSRRQECSTGLHIARRKYLGNFGGDVITIVKVAPEDVIAVPYNEPDKMRAAAYHIVAVLPQEVHSLLRSDRPMTTNETAAKILADVIKGNHIGVIEHVRIGGPKGTKLTIEKVKGAGKAPEALTSGTATALDDGAQAGPVVSVRELRQKVNQVESERKAKAPTKPKAKAKKAPAKKAAPKAKAKTPAPVKKQPAAAPAQPIKAPFDHPKKADVQRLLAEGKSYRAIESALSICRKTIKKLDPNAAA